MSKFIREERIKFSSIESTNPVQAFLPSEDPTREFALMTLTVPMEIVYRDSRTEEVVSTDLKLGRVLLMKNGNLVTLGNYDPNTLINLGLNPRKEGFLVEPRVSGEFVKKIQDGNIKAEDIPTVQQIHEKLISLLTTFIELENELEYSLLATWIIGTYFHQLFSSFPYLFVHGMKRTGKSKLLHFLKLTCFNGILTNNITTSSLFRLIEDVCPTVLMDETEDLNDPSRKLDFRSILLAGYKKGERVYRTEGEGKKKPMGFETFCPKALANIAGIEDVLLDRAVTIVMPRSSDKRIINSRINENSKIWIELREQLILLALSRWKELKAIYDNIKVENEIITARELELWEPVLAIAEWVSPSLKDSLIKLAEERSLERHLMELDLNRDYKVLTALLIYAVEDEQELTTSQVKDWISVTLDEPVPKWLTSVWVGRALTRLGFSSRKDKMLGGKRRYKISKAKVEALANKLGLPIDEIRASLPQPGLLDIK